MSGMLDAHVIAYDYPNYGASSKTSMCESALNSSIEAVYARCMEIGIPQDKLILMGQSLGSVPTLHLASRVVRARSAVRRPAGSCSSPRLCCSSHRAPA
jgi:hypothetical protein